MRGCGCCDSLRWGYEAVFASYPRRGQPVLSAALCGKTTPWSSRSLPRKQSFLRPGDGGCVRNAFWRDPRFSKISKRGLAISHEIGYTVCRVKRKAAVSRLLQQAIWKRSFLCAVFFSGARSLLRCNHQAFLLSLILPQAISSVHSSSRSRRSRCSNCSILPSASSRSTALTRCSSVPTISKSVR